MLPLVVAVFVLILWMIFGDWRSDDVGGKAADQAAAIATELYGTSTAKSNSFALDGAVSPPQEATPNLINDNGQKYMHATLRTSMGDITIEFSPDAPKTVENFVNLAKGGFYDGTKFHRVISGFMIQGGDPFTKDDSKQAMWGTGGPGYTFKDEIHANNRNEAGTISMANAGPNTNGSQFFINVADNNFLDTKHTVFGKVTAGMDVVMKISQVHTNEQDRPAEPILIQSVSLQ